MTTKEYQPATSALETSVLPDAISSIVLSGGRTIPFRYYLGANSTVPLVRLESPTTSKELTWGDVVELPPGSAVSVRNISYMPGDIQIQSGPIPAPGPRRVTIPIQFDVSFQRTTPGGVPLDLALFSTRYPCDTRRAKRAYLAIGTGQDTVVHLVQYVLRGFNQQHSGSAQAGLPVYTDQYHFTNASPDMIPLGTSLEGNAMRLADYVHVDAVFQYDSLSRIFQLVDMFYVLEY